MSIRSIPPITSTGGNRLKRKSSMVSTQDIYKTNPKNSGQDDWQPHVYNGSNKKIVPKIIKPPVKIDAPVYIDTFTIDNTLKIMIQGTEYYIVKDNILYAGKEQISIPSGAVLKDFNFNGGITTLMYELLKEK